MNGGRGEVLRLRSGFRLAARTPPKRLKFDSAQRLQYSLLKAPSLPLGFSAVGSLSQDWLIEFLAAARAEAKELPPEVFRLQNDFQLSGLRLQNFAHILD